MQIHLCIRRTDLQDEDKKRKIIQAKIWLKQNTNINYKD